MYNGLSVKQLGLLTNGKQINWSNKSIVLVHKEFKLKINGMFNECFYLSKLVF